MRFPNGIFSESYTQETAVIRTKTQWALTIGSLILLFTVPLWLPQIPILGTSIIPLHVMNLIGIYIIAVLGLQIMMGYCGQVSLGHAAFVAAGAYISGILSAQLGFPFWVALPFAAIGAGLIGVVFGAASLRIRGFYLVASTLAAQFIIIWFLNWWAPVTRSDLGLVVPYPTIGSFTFNSHSSLYYIIMVCLVVATFFARNLIRTRIGRAFIAVRDNELAAEVMGIRLVTTKLLAFFIGCAYAGVAGSLWGQWVHIILPEQFNLWLSIWFLGYLIVGGMGTTVGPFFGVILIVILSNGLTQLVTVVAAASPAATTAAVILRDLVFGLIIIIFLLFEPRGLAHRWTLFKTYYRRWPFT